MAKKGPYISKVFIKDFPRPVLKPNIDPFPN